MTPRGYLWKKRGGRDGRKGQEGISKGTKENGVQPFIPSLCTYASSIDRNRRGEFPMWGGSYLIHSPWVLPTLLGDYFTADGEGGGGRGDETCRLYRAHRRGPKSIRRIFAFERHAHDVSSVPCHSFKSYLTNFKRARLLATTYGVNFRPRRFRNTNFQTDQKWNEKSVSIQNVLYLYE